MNAIKAVSRLSMYAFADAECKEANEERFQKYPLFKIGKPCKNFFPSYYLKKSSLSFSHVVLLFETNANLTIGHFHLMSH